MRPLSERLKDWTDFDVAAHALAASLGLMPDDLSWAMGKGKHVFWTNNPLGFALHDMLEELVTVGVLLRNEEAQFKYNPDFRGSWEPPRPDDAVVWPDGSWCHHSELEQMTHKSDDYEIVPMHDPRYAAIVEG